ncbi:uncharacterized protein LOC143280560 [Babylonia areolata]|uniref:uncharacterized protein LOC143280560 n=1 Tax=Babylonia areolata TaxID=304850 RepID=UPI003FD2E6EB
MLRNAESSDHNKTHGNLQRAQADNPDLSRPASENAVHEKRGRKRKSCLVDAIFPSSLPAPKRGRGSSQIKENQCKRISLIPSDAVEQLSSKSSSKGRKKGVGNRRKTLVKNKGNESVSSLCSTSSILGSSLSMVFNGISRTSQSKLGPSRNSLAEFKVAKPQCQGKQVSLSRDQSSQDVERDVKKMCLLKFHLAGVPSLVMTSLHREEQDFVIGAVKRLGVFRIEDKVSKHTTHVVCGEARRTLNVLNGLARGCWLISKEWVERSMEDGSWTCEEGYEMVEDFPKSKEARLAREAEEPGAYRCRIFEPVGFIFVSNICTPPRAQLIRLLQLCGAKVTDSIHRADFYIGDSAHDEKNSVKPVWVLDSISQMELLPMDDYILAINHKAKSSSSPEF